MMQIIPVIDLLDGTVVHAKKGERQHYQPIKSLLTPSSKPLDIVAALLDLYPFSQLYVADLNAIQKLGDNFNVIHAISQKFPQLKLWLDAGISNNPERNIVHSNVILGSENFSMPENRSNLENFLTLKHQLKNDFVLSLDFMPSGYQGPADLLQTSAHWPQNVIVMLLANVGANQGLNTDLINEIMALAKGHNVYVAGGIRHVEDLAMLKKMGVHGALIATALHQKQLTFRQLKDFCQ